MDYHCVSLNTYISFVNCSQTCFKKEKKLEMPCNRAFGYTNTKIESDIVCMNGNQTDCCHFEYQLMKTVLSIFN